MDIHVPLTSIVKYPCMDTTTWISIWISTLAWGIEDLHPKIMDIHMYDRGFFEIHGYAMDSRTWVNLQIVHHLFS